MHSKSRFWITTKYLYLYNLIQAIDDLLAINDYTADSSSGTDAPPAQTDRVHKNDAIKGPDHPYRTEMSLVLSYDGQKSKYTTSSDLEKAQEIGTPPPNVPQAMKLLPNKLPYASTTASKSDIEINAIDSPRNDANNENDTNEKLLTKSQVKLIVTDECKASLEKGCGSQEVNNDDDYSVAGTSNENNKSVEQFDMVRLFSTVPISIIIVAYYYLSRMNASTL